MHGLIFSLAISCRWRERRRRLLQSQYPTFVAAAGDKSIDALVERATPGHAWQADHIVAVYLGGGQCDVDNLRTLCTACHKKRTKKQALERARERRGAKKDAVANGGQPARLRGKRARGAHIDSDSDGGGAGLAHEGAAGGGGQRGRGRGMRRGRQRGKGREGGGEDDSAGVGEIEVIDLT